LANGTALKVERSRVLADLAAGDQSDLFPVQDLDRAIRGTALVIDGEPVPSGLDAPARRIVRIDPLGYCDRCSKTLPGGSRCPKIRCGTSLATA
jgi:hypothetical protein